MSACVTMLGCPFATYRTLPMNSKIGPDATAISNQIKYYLTANRGNFLEMHYGFYWYALQVCYDLLLKEHLPKNQKWLERDCLMHHCQRSLRLSNWSSIK